MMNERFELNEMELEEVVGGKSLWEYMGDAADSVCDWINDITGENICKNKPNRKINVPSL